MQKYDKIYKIIFIGMLMIINIVIGSSCAGKTSLLTRYCDNAYNISYSSTIGIDFRLATKIIND